MIKTKSIALLLWLFFVVIISGSCLREQSGSAASSFEVLIDMVAYKKHSIQLFYVTKSDDSYSEELSLRKNISGNGTPQRLIFSLPVGVKVKNIRIDLGEKDNENDSIVIKNILFCYKNLQLNGRGGRYKSWFELNENVVQNRDNNVYYLKKSHGNFDPQLNGNRTLNRQLVKLFPPNIYEK